jgi:hypothetical protein
MINYRLESFIAAHLTNARNILLLRRDELQKIGNFTLDDVKRILTIAAQTLVKPDSSIGLNDPNFVIENC